MILHLDPAHGTGLDQAVASVPEITLYRRGDGCFVRVPLPDSLTLIRALAYAGIAARANDVDLAAPAGIAATSDDLRPAPADLVACDVVRVRRLPLGQATALVLHRRFAALRPPSTAAQRRCRALLRGEDALFAWDRQAWIERRRVGALRRCSSLRPVIFDQVTGREGRAFASDGALAAWAFA